MKYFYGDYENHLIKTFTILITILVILSMLKAEIVKALTPPINKNMQIRSVYEIENVNNTSTNLTNNYTLIQSGGTYYWYSVSQTKPKLKWTFEGQNIEQAYYDIDFNIYTQGRQAIVYIEHGSAVYSCKNYSVSYEGDTIAPQAVKCENIFIYGQSAFTIYMVSDATTTGTNYSMISRKFTFTKREDTAQEISDTNTILNSDNASSDSKTNVDNTSYEQAHAREQALLNSATYDTNTINITYDRNAAIWVWNTITRYLNANVYIMGLMLTILSIGIIKQVLNR